MAEDTTLSYNRSSTNVKKQASGLLHAGKNPELGKTLSLLNADGYF
jgi:hypothetical protein